MLNSSVSSDIISIKEIGLSYTGTYQRVYFKPAYEIIYHPITDMVPLEVFIYLNKICLSSRVGHIYISKEKNKFYCENQLASTSGHELCLKTRQLERKVHNKVCNLKMVSIFYASSNHFWFYARVILCGIP